MLIGEALHDSEAQDRMGGALTSEDGSGNKKDHWYFGGDDSDVDTDHSEALGSTGVPINYQKNFPNIDICTRWVAGCQKLQLSFSSAHPGGMQMVRCDGSVDFVPESIDEEVWRDLGTRAGQLPAASSGPRGP